MILISWKLSKSAGTSMPKRNKIIIKKVEKKL